MQRRSFLQSSAALSLLGLGACATTSIPAKARVVVVGGGYGGATAAKYLRMWSNGSVEVTLVERNTEFISCPISNLVIGGTKTIAYLNVAPGADGFKSLTIDAATVTIHGDNGSGLRAIRIMVEQIISLLHQFRRSQNRFDKCDAIHEAFITLADNRWLDRVTGDLRDDRDAGRGPRAIFQFRDVPQKRPRR